jgi:hypothetical protein
VCVALIVNATTGGRGWGLLTPAVAGLAAAGGAWMVTLAAAPKGSVRV